MKEIIIEDDGIACQTEEDDLNFVDQEDSPKNKWNMAPAEFFSETPLVDSKKKIPPLKSDHFSKGNNLSKIIENDLVFSSHNSSLANN